MSRMYPRRFGWRCFCQTAELLCFKIRIVFEKQGSGLLKWGDIAKLHILFALFGFFV